MKPSLIMAICSLLTALPVLVLNLVVEFEYWQQRALVLAILFAIVAGPICSVIAIAMAIGELREGVRAQSVIALVVAGLWALTVVGVAVVAVIQYMRGEVH